MADNPHFASPFRVVGGVAQVLEQGTDEEILQCVETILRTPAGSRVEQPDFGMDDPTFTTDPTVIERDILAAIEENEPRVRALADAVIADRIATVNVSV